MPRGSLHQRTLHLAENNDMQAYYNKKGLKIGSIAENST
jgi:hypothetical protein